MKPQSDNEQSINKLRPHQKWEYYRDFERLLNKIKLSEEFMAMWREEQTLWDVMFPLYPDKNKKDKSYNKMSDKLQIFSDGCFRITFCFKREIFFQLTLEILKFQLCF